MNQRSAIIRNSNIDACVSITDSLSSSLGPRGLDKMIVCGKDVTVTNDGATILTKLKGVHPVSKILTNLSQAQDEACGDGTTSVVVLTGALLKACKSLLKLVHPSAIIEALERIKIAANVILEDAGIPIGDSEGELIRNVITSLSSKVVSSCAEEMALISVKAMKKAGSLKNIKIVKKVGGSIEETKLVDGVVLNKNIKDNIQGINRKMKVLMAQFCLSAPKTNIDSKILIEDADAMDRIIKEERDYIVNICKKIKESGCELLIVQKSIMRDSLSSLAYHFLKKLNIMVIEDVEREEIDFISKTFGIKPISDVDLIPSELRELGIKEEEESGERITTLIDKGNIYVSILVRGSDNMIVDETERSLVDALSVVKSLIDNPKKVPGGGHIEMLISMIETEDMIERELYKAFECIPYYLCRNGGVNLNVNKKENLLEELRSKINNKSYRYQGINIRKGKVDNMIDHEIVQPLSVSVNVVNMAIETTAMILKIDDVLPTNRI
ncbi:T-complex protein 1 subunit delta [Spraguea lophii 42_110]|uniref:T-complex protein 1 subunit delta n=1 Tax=Spraguea lophii (strain 42_110) TaxID=1358809 RepID=S7WAR7_SPRLO|nr:T-complex protein 1 subunit delta [Spraguea lophii 42_110]